MEIVGAFKRWLDGVLNCSRFLTMIGTTVLDVQSETSPKCVLAQPKRQSNGVVVNEILGYTIL